MEKHRTFYIVQEKNYNSCICEPETEDFSTTTFFTDEELEEFGYDNPEKLEGEIKYFDETDPKRVAELKQYENMFSGIESL